jgi:DNA-binding transcriptional MerR regulator
LYRRKDVELVLEIKRLLYEKRYTIEGARKFLDSRGRDVSTKTPDTTAKVASRSQGDLFENSAHALEVVRKELTELLDLLR